MFQINMIRPNLNRQIANDHGYNDAWLGLPNENPYQIGTFQHREYDKGYQEGEELIEEFVNAPIYGIGRTMYDDTI